jgi:hypothetical protein
MLYRVALVRTNISEESIASIIRVKRISKLLMEVICSSETLVLTRAARHRIPEDDILQQYL